MSLTLEYVLNKSLSRINALNETVANATILLIKLCYKRGINIVITQGLRTIAEQDKLYAQGRTAPGSIVTNAKGGYSYHNFGVAVDFALLLNDKGQVSWDMKCDLNNDGKADWQQVIEVAKQLGFKWGGDWTSFKDYPHLEMTFGLTCTDYRNSKKPSSNEVTKIKSLLMKAENELVKDDEPMTKEEKLVFDNLCAQVESLTKSKDVLKQTITEQGNLILKLQAKLSMDVPPYAQGVVSKLSCMRDKNGNPVVDTPNGKSEAFYQAATVLDRIGLFDK